VVASSAVPLSGDAGLPLTLRLLLVHAKLLQEPRHGETLLSELSQQAVGLLLTSRAGRRERSVANVLLEPLDEVHLSARLVQEREPDDIAVLQVERLLDLLAECGSS
jgi:hypothetical protein